MIKTDHTRIYQLLSEGVEPQAIAERIGCCPSVIYRLRSKRRKHESEENRQYLKSED